MNNKTKVLVIFGGQSGEHEVSVISAASVIKALHADRYEIQTIGITKEGSWYWGARPEAWKEAKADITNGAKQVAVVLSPQKPYFQAIDGSELPHQGRCDIIFPVMHGPKGEDGTIQGLFEMAGFPYVGSGVLGSSLGMDKDRMKAVFKEAGLPIVPHLTLLRSEINAAPKAAVKRISDSIGFPCFIKPANLGSSVGISKAEDDKQLLEALIYAAKFDRKIVIEKGVKAREVELSVLGNESAKASIPGEIKPAKDFYDYEAKYLDNSSELIIPAILSQKLIEQLQSYAVTAFEAVGASGLSRVDFFVTEDKQIFINEINTMPGFTQISMYPKLWEASGLSYSLLLDELIRLGFEKFKDDADRRLS
ncbi:MULTISPECIES: D-alanine--D-alanine ligase family protein [Dehalobacter]|jgi:D-alanine-D-alanine ligase|uniref:D-alanine--D-alanine ligase n=1 Tax=Dehalobacter restrictus TaxID=55583 RepID=A0A857DIT1_9FIRM|nr:MULTISPECIES: D-alanine--D-alanine ligase family protein [Dehalobacter]MCG1026231.1 D-alanine--D-alanine ligase [Dehalobacter sp.]MDJ0304566.1 D-alanine--D-alanine ligase [Dehalobacter sp.]OCZ53281.1 D-alanine--D-alanine ligase A [Dehalobacter sp. TeCB1]QHA00518.1 D-alanine--D-alanine ligase [Dehalobacter restrictus]